MVNLVKVKDLCKNMTMEKWNMTTRHATHYFTYKYVQGLCHRSVWEDLLGVGFSNVCLLEEAIVQTIGFNC